MYCVLVCQLHPPWQRMQAKRILSSTVRCCSCFIKSEPSLFVLTWLHSSCSSAQLIRRHLPAQQSLNVSADAAAWMQPCGSSSRLFAGVDSGGRTDNADAHASVRMGNAHCAVTVQGWCKASHGLGCETVWHASAKLQSLPINRRKY